MKSQETKTSEKDVDIDDILGRLADAARALEAMDKNEREAALRYLKSRYQAEWPSSNDY